MMNNNIPDKLNPYSPPKAKWHPVNYAGYWHIQDGQYYGDRDMLNAEIIGEVQAEINANLCASAPELLREVEELRRELQHHKTLLKNSEKTNSEHFQDKEEMRKDIERLTFLIKKAWFTAVRNAKIANTKVIKGSTVNLMTFQQFEKANNLEFKEENNIE